MAGGLWLARRGAERHEVAVADTVAAVRALVDAAQRELRRESALLAKDPTIVEGVLKRDWATLARGASPRMLALTLERTADLLLVLDATGAPLVQVPATPRVEVLALSRPAEAVTRVAVVNSHAYLVGLAPLPAGMVVVGRRVESLARVLEGLPSRPAVVALAGDLAVGGTLPGVPLQGWRDAARSRRVTVNGETWLARPLDEAAGEGLWALVPEGPRRAAERRVWFVWALSLVAATGVALVARATVSRSVGTGPPGGGGVLTKERSGSVVASAARPAPVVGGLIEERGGTDTPESGATGRFPEGRRPELEAVHAIAVATGGSDDLVATAERMLEIVCGVARMAFGGLYRFDPAAQTLVLVAHRGHSPEDVAELSVRPLDASHVGEALRLGHLVVTDLTRSRVLASAVRERIAAGGYSTQLSLPITVNGAVWGVMALIGRERRTFDGDELTLLQAAAHQVGQAVARATLFEETRERSRRLETLMRLAQTLTATLSTGARDRHEYTREELSVLGSLALHAANALNNARRFSEESDRRAHLGALLEINKKIGSKVPTEALLSSIAEEAARFLDVDNAGFRLLQGEDLVLAGLAGTAAQTMTRPRIRVGESLSGRVVATGRTLVCEIQSVPDVAPENVEADRRLGYTMFLGVPLRVGTRTIGALAFRARRAFTPRDAEIAEAFADQAAIALDHARLHAETTRRLEETGALLEVVEILNSTLDAKQLLRRVAIKIARVCRVDRCSVAQWEGGEVTPLMAQYADGRKTPVQWAAFQGMASRLLHEIPATGRAFGADMVGAYFLDERKETLVPLGGYHVPRHLVARFTTRPIVLARVPELLPPWRAGRAVWSPDPRHDPRFDPEWVEGLPPHSVLLASATAPGEPIGALFAVWRRPGRRFLPSETRLVEGVAAQVGLV